MKKSSKGERKGGVFSFSLFLFFLFFYGTLYRGLEVIGIYSNNTVDYGINILVLYSIASIASKRTGSQPASQNPPHSSVSLFSFNH